MFQKIFTLSLSLIFTTIMGYCQTSDPAKPPQVVPLSPNAAEFAKYGNIPVSETTGVPNISIPIYEINTGKIKVPISLSYHASGIKVSQRATWVGLGWSLNAGGIISRSVRGLPDEKTDGWMGQQNTSATINNSTNYDELMRYADNLTDAAPDFFSYNMPSLSGRFIYSQSSSSFRTIPFEPIKISRITGAGGTYTDNTYQITDIDGTNYYFQDKQSYYEELRPTANYVQSWYLSKIVSADTKDTVQFNYTTFSSAGGTNEELAESETHSYSDLIDDDPINGPSDNYHSFSDKGSTLNQSYFYYSYINLKEIIYKQGKVTFYANTPRRDSRGWMLDSLTVFSKSGNVYTPVYKYTLNHDYFTTPQPHFDDWDYRLRLLSLSKVPLIPNGSAETHQFVYNSTPLPAINSRGMDYWGFYNGGDSFQGYLPAILPSPSELSKFALGNQYVGYANRNASKEHMKAGILEKIVYPTKGYTIFNYEPHQYISDQTQTETKYVVLTSLTGIGKRTIKTASTNFTWPVGTDSNTGAITIDFTPHTNPSSFEAAQRVTLTDLTSNVSKIWEHPGDFTKASTITESYNFDPAHQYQVTLLVDDDAPTKVNFSLIARITSTTPVVKDGGGLRVESMQNFDHTNALLSTEKYVYNGVIIGKNDILLANNYVKKNMFTANNPSGSHGCTPVDYHDIYYYANSGYGGQNFEGANVLYSQVTKTNYDNNNKPNGKTISYFDTFKAFDYILNPTFPGGREYIDNSSGRTGLPLREEFYKSNIDGSWLMLKSKSFDYGYGSPGFSSENITQVTRNFFLRQNGVDCRPRSSNDFTRYNYGITVVAAKLASVSETDFDNNGPIMTTTTAYSYDNPVHMQVTKTTTTSSDGKTLIAQNKYPADYTDATYGTDQLRSQAINNKLVEQIVTRDGNIEKQVVTNYRSFQGSVLPDQVSMAISGGALEARLKYNNYDAQSNVTEVAKVGAPLTSYKWAYNNAYPIAQVVNASSAEFYYEGNEESTAAGVAPGTAHTGNKYTTIALVSWTKPNSRSYVISYWYLSGGVWKYSGEQAYPGPTFTMVAATGYDDVRIYPSDAQMTTYTYAPLVGMTSATDAKGMTTTYEYDNLQRLMNVRDKDGYIVKHMDYHYQGQ